MVARLCLLSVLPPLVAGCNPWDEEEIEGLRHLWGTFSAPSDGDTKVGFRVEDGEVAMMTVVQAEPERSTIAGLDSPDAAEVYKSAPTADHLSTNAGFVAPVSVLNWPVLDTDAVLVPGRWTTTVGVVDENLQFVPGDFRFDAWLAGPATTGTLDVTIHFADGLFDDDEVRDAVDAGVEHWRDLYAPIGVTLEVEQEEWTGGIPGLPGDPPDVWEGLSAGSVRRVNVVFVGNISGIPDAFGLAGGIPGPLGSTSISGVLVSSVLSSGTDGHFSPEEIRILGETLAHETGHYLGLFHPVEIGWDQWDALDDTADCTSEDACLTALGGNVMFPYPVCSLVGCAPQSALTDDQSGVAHRHVAIQ